MACQLTQVQPSAHPVVCYTSLTIVMHTNYATLLLSAIWVGCLEGLHEPCSCTVATMLHMRLPILYSVKASVSA